MIGIYKIENLINGKVYIGQSTNIKRRWDSHKSTAFNPSSEDYEYPLYRAIRKYGLDNFSFEVLEECKKENLNEKEKFYIAKYHAHGQGGYNQDDGGFGGSHNFKLTDADVLAIINRLKTTRDNTKTIAKDFGVGATTIHYINIGQIYYRDTEQYPIRPHLNKLIDSEIGGYQERKHNYSCIVCGTNISKGCTYCVKCYPHSRKCENRPSPLELARLVKEHGFQGVGVLYNVADRTVQGWCEDYKLPHHKTDLINWYNEQMGIQTNKPVKKTREDYMKPVKQVDMNTGDVLNVFKSACEAGRFLGKSNGNHIAEVCRGKLAFAYGYYWEYA